MEGRRVDVSKRLYKTEILFLKILPMLLAGFYFIGTVLSLFNIDVAIITYLSGMSLIPLLFMYISSYVFKFCSYHRMFLHYVSFGMILNCLDWYVGIPLNNKEFLSVFLIITFIFLFVILYLYLKSRRNEKSINKNP
jgi:hypothetical protein